VCLKAIERSDIKIYAFRIELNEMKILHITQYKCPWSPLGICGQISFF
jgi:hypothetical protein